MFPVTELRPIQGPYPSGDTSGLTDQANIQGLLNIMPPGGGLYLPTWSPQQYIVRGNLSVPGGVRVFGDWAPQDNPADFSSVVPAIRLASGANPVAVFVSAGYFANNTAPDAPQRIQGLSIDCNGANNTTGGDSKNSNAGSYGVVMMNHNGKVDENFFLNPASTAVVQADYNSAGSSVTLALNECQIRDNKVLWTSPATTANQYGIWVTHSVSSGNIADGYCERNIVQGAGAAGIRIEAATDWNLERNHVYASQGDGIQATNCSATRIVNNTVDRFGVAAAGGIQYNGISFSLLGATTMVPPLVMGNTFEFSDAGSGATVTYVLLNVNGVSAGVAVSAHIAKNRGSRGATGSAALYAYGVVKTASSTINLSVDDPGLWNGTFTASTPAGALLSGTGTLTLTALTYP